MQDPAPQPQKTLPKLAHLWLLLVFLSGVVLRFLPGQPAKDDLNHSMRLGERVALMAKFKSDMPSSARQQLLQAARVAEAEHPVRLKVIDSQPVFAEELSKLPPTYRLMAEYLSAPTPAKEQALIGLADLAMRRLTLCLSMLAALVISALGLSFFAGTQQRHPVTAMALLAPTSFVALFMVWDVGNLFGIGVVFNSLGLNKVMPPLLVVLLAQLIGYGFFLLLLKLVRPKGGPWNLSVPFPAAWVGRGYFASYVMVFSANILIGAVSGHTPTSSNPLLGMFLNAGQWQVWVLATLVVAVGPTFEELIFRGWLLGGLRQSWGDTRALVVSAALFAVIHGDPWATPALFLLGCVFGGVYLRSGSLCASILLHAMWNATTFTFLLANMP